MFIRCCSRLVDGSFHRASLLTCTNRNKVVESHSVVAPATGDAFGRGAYKRNNWRGFHRAAVAGRTVCLWRASERHACNKRRRFISVRWLLQRPVVGPSICACWWGGREKHAKRHQHRALPGKMNSRNTRRMRH